MSNNHLVDEKQETSPQLNRNTSFLRSEAIAVAFATGALYLFTYFFQRSYLAHFGVPSNFVEFSLGSSVVSAAFILLFFVTIFNALIFFPAALTKEAFRLIYALSPLFMVFSFAITYYWSSGFTWMTVILAFTTLIITLGVIVSLVRNFLLGKSYSDWIKKEIENEDKARQHFIWSRLVDKLSPEQLVVLVALIFSTFLGGQIVGSWRARSINDFLALKIDGVDFIVVSDFRNGFVVASIEESNLPKNFFHASGDIRWISLDDINMKPMASRSVQVLSQPGRRKGTWTTWAVFWERLWINSSSYDRR